MTKNFVFLVVCGTAMLSIIAMVIALDGTPWWEIVSVAMLQVIPLVTLYRHRALMPAEVFIAMMLLYMAIDRVAAS